MITVANVKTFRLHDVSPQTAVVYIGRSMPGRKGSPLRNPFKLKKDESREECLLEYLDWLNSLPCNSEEHRELARLVDVARKEDLVLLCWCAPEKCHGDVIKEMIEQELIASYMLRLKRPQGARSPTSEITTTDGPPMSITISAADGPVMLSSAWESPSPLTCTWSEDPDDGSYDTDCGNKHVFIEGTPAENGYRFCPYCGGAMRDAAVESEER